MSYVSDNLLNNERIVHESRLHWTLYLHWNAFLTLFILPWLRRRTSEFAVTDHRIIIKIGIFSRKTVDLNLAKIETVDVDQQFLGRLFGYGTLVIIGTGGTKETFTHISQPIAFRRAVQQATLDLQGTPALADASPRRDSQSAAERLAKAKELLDQGLITEDEFSQVKQRVIGEL